MSLDLRAVSVHARATPADERARFAERAASVLPAGTILVSTCHRVEAFGSHAALAPLHDGPAPRGLVERSGEEGVRHLARLAVGLESAVVAEDQVLHQLRRSVQAARERGPLSAQLDRLFDTCLRAGRRARTWLPAQSGGLAELALRRVIGRRDAPATDVLLVGAGEMGRRAGHALAVRGATIAVASRTPERAHVLAAELSARSLPFDPRPGELAAFDGIVVALAGGWPLGDDSREAIIDGAGWVIDLSAPPALDQALADALGPRLTTVDQLADTDSAELSGPLLGRLEALVEATVTEYISWAERDTQRRLARALAERAHEAQAKELVALWQRMPDLAPEQRAEVERMARHLTERLLRDPLEQLDRDRDGRQAEAARELFRL